MRFLPIGPRAMLVELDDLDQTLALFDALKANPVAGISEIIPAARTLMIQTASGVVADAKLAAEILTRKPAPDTAPILRSSEIIELPVTYDGEDLADVAKIMDLSVREVIDAHQAAIWQVAFCGFAPGFAYMAGNDPRFDLPRRTSPRTRIPAGSLALGGRFCGVYPQETPGGWQLIGHTTVPMWDLNRTPPALLRPGQRCQFIERKAEIYPSIAVAESEAQQGLHILSTAFPILFQDEGRAGQSELGISASGAMDQGAMHRANRAVGNQSDWPVLEITLGPVRLRADLPMVLALTGAAQANINGNLIATGAAFALDTGDIVLIEPPKSGMRSYLALRGGYQVAPVLHSAAYDTLAYIGPAPLTSGSTIALANLPVQAVSEPEYQPNLPQAGDVIELPVTLGPRTDWFSSEVVQQFLRQEWLVTAQSSRVGIRLQGEIPLKRDDERELPSEGTAIGAVQVPHSGQPVLFLADHPLTGGYPVIATLLPQAIDMAGQIPPGARIRFTATADFTPITLARPR